MDAGLLDVLHDRADVRVGSVAERVDVDLDRVLEEAVDEQPPAHNGRFANRLGVVADAHAAPAEHVGRPHQHRVADPFRDLDRFVRGARRAPGRHLDSELAAERRKALAVLGEVDGLERRAQDPETGGLDRPRELQRRLPAELDHDSLRLFPLADREHLLRAERLEVEPVRRVVVGRDGFRVAVHHHRLVAERAEALRRMDTAVVELDPLADPVRAGAEDHHRASGRRCLVRLAPGRVEVVRAGLYLPGAGVHASVDRTHSPLPPLRAYDLLADSAGRADVRV